jgi:hypothetical protein
MATYSLGEFTFINFESLQRGGPEIVRETSVPIQRPGVAGTGFIQTGVKGRPFQMRSIVDVVTRADAIALTALYEQALSKELLRIIHADADYSATPIFNLYWPWDVQHSWRKVSSAVGGLNGGTHIVEAIWTLIPVFVEPEEEE